MAHTRIHKRAHAGGVVKTARDGTLTLRDAGGQSVQVAFAAGDVSIDQLVVEQHAPTQLTGRMMAMRAFDGEPCSTYVRMSVSEQALLQAGSPSLGVGDIMQTPAGRGRVVRVDHDPMAGRFEMEVQVDHARERDPLQGMSFSAMVIDEPVHRPNECACAADADVERCDELGGFVCTGCGYLIVTDEQLRRGELPF